MFVPLTFSLPDHVPCSHTQPQPLLAQLGALSSRPVARSFREETNPLRAASLDVNCNQVNVSQELQGEAAGL